MALGALLRGAGLPADAGVAELAERAEAGDERTLAALEEAGRWLGIGVGSAANLLNSSGIVIGGYLATLATWLAPALEQELNERVLAAAWDPPVVVRSELGSEAAVRGAAAAALRRVFADPGIVAEL